MRTPDHDPRQDCRVIPFVRPKVSDDPILTSSIAAVIAVTVLHREDESPEKRLLDIIDSSGDAEVLDIADTHENHEALGAAPQPSKRPDNDNTVMTLL